MPEVVEAGDRLHEDVAEAHGVDWEGCGRRRDGHQAGADPSRRAGGEPPCSGHHRAAGDQRVAAGVFVALGTGPGKPLAPPRRIVSNNLRRDPVEHRVADADRRYEDLAAIDPAGQEQMPGLAPEKGDGQRRARRDAADLAGAAVDAARHIHRDNWQPLLLERRDDFSGDALDRAGEPGAEDRVDDDAVAVERRGGGRLDRSWPARGRHGRVALQRLARPEQRQAHRPAALGQDARRDKAVAAIVAGAAQHRERPLRPAPRHRVGNGAAGILHQFDARGAAGDCQPVGLAHLGRGQQRAAAPACGKFAHPRRSGEWRDGGKARLGAARSLTLSWRLATSSRDGGCSSGG